MVDFHDLFGNQDSCACDECRSVLGPPAYFVDVMRRLNGAGSSLLSPSRRQDLAFTELSCENTLTALPYIDLACEVLETSIRGTVTSDDSAGDLPRGNVPPRLKDTLAIEGCPVTDAAKVTAFSGGAWIVRDAGVVAKVTGASSVIEVLVVPQTSDTAENLRAAPQHVRALVYMTTKDAAIVGNTISPRQSLASGTRGFTLPFFLGLLEARVFLEHLGVPRKDLMAAFEQSDDAIAIEALGLSQDAWDVLTGKTARSFEDAWLDATLRDVQNSVTFLLNRSGLTYDELTAALATRFVNRHDDNLFDILFADDADPCNLDAAQIERQSPPPNTEDVPVDGAPDDIDGALDRMRRFTLLQRKLGWSARSLDVVLTALAPRAKISPLSPTGSADLAFALAEIARLTGEYDLSPEEVVSLWGPIDADGDDSLYARTFLDAAVHRPVDPSLAVRASTAPATDPAIDPRQKVFEIVGKVGTTLADYEAALLAGLRIDARDLAAILEEGTTDANPATTLLPDGLKLTLANVSSLYRVALLARMLEMRVADLLTLRRSSGVEPFGRGALRTTRDFIALAGAISDSSFTMARLAYLTAGEADPSDTSLPSYDAVTGLAATLRNGILKIQRDNAEIDNPSIDVVRAKLGSLLKGDTAAKIAALIGDAVAFSAEVGTTALDATFLAKLTAAVAVDTELAGRVTYDADTNVLRMSGVLTDGGRATLLGLGGSPDFDTAVQGLYDQPRDLLKSAQLDFLTDAAIDGLFQAGVTVAQRTNDFLVLLLPALRRQLTVRFVKQALSASLPLGIAAADALASDPLSSQFEELQKIANVPDGELSALAAATWNGRIVAPFSETFTFDVEGNGDVLVSLDGVQLARGTVTSGGPPLTATAALVAGDVHELSVQFTPRSAGAAVQVAWSSSSMPRRLVSDGTGVSNELAKFTGARWDGRIIAPVTETFTFEVAGDGAVTLRLDGQPIQSGTVATGGAPLVASAPLVAGESHDLSIDFTPANAGASIALTWHSPSMSRRLVADASVAANDLGAFGATSWRIAPPLSERFTFHFEGEGQIVAYLDGKLFAQGSITPASAQVASVDFVAGQYRDLSVKFVPGPSGAPLRVTWTSPSTPREVVPDVYLFRADTLDAFGDAYDAFFRAASIVTGFGLTTKEIRHLATHGADFDGFAWAPSALPTPAPVLFRRWRRLHDLVSLRKTLRAAPFELVDAFAAARTPPSNGPTSREMILTLTGWAPAAFDDVLAFFKLTAADLVSEVPIARVKRAFTALSRLGVSAEKAASWATAEPDLDAAREVKNAAKAKHADAEWPGVAGPLSDVVRKAKRDALVAHILANDDRFKDKGTNELFDHFLIDAGVECCMDTSRLKQAIGSLQLFVQRCLMGLSDNGTDEPSIDDDDFVADWKKWMKSYRVWEASRQIFLYPENWIEPELRDDKTPFFKDLENELAQADVTKDAVEAALKSYLEKLDDVARLEVAAFYVEHVKNGKVDAEVVIHIIGRTFAKPHKYYYRTRTTLGGIDGEERPTAVWSPWEKVDVEIQSDHLIAVMFHRRLHLVWPVFATKQDDPDNKGPKYMEVGLAWTHYQGGKWAPKNVSLNDQALRFYQTTYQVDGDFVVATAPGGLDAVFDPSLYVFRASLNDGTLSVECEHEASFTFPPDTGPFGPPAPVIIVGSAPKQNQVPKAPGPCLLRGVFTFSDCRGSVSVTKNLAVSPTTLLAPATARLTGEMLVDPNPDRLLPPQSPKKKAVVVNHPLDLLETNTTEIPVLWQAPLFRVKFATDVEQFLSQEPFFFEDNLKSFLVTPLAAPPTSFTNQLGLDLVPFGEVIALQKRTGSGGAKRAYMSYDFETFYHPYVCEALGRLNKDGVDAFFGWPIQDDGKSPPSPIKLENEFFATRYHPASNGAVDKPYPVEDLDFGLEGREGSTAYSQYNWELFFHVPLLVATRLATNQKFEDALSWFHYIFDPTTKNNYLDKPAKYWRFREFFEETENNGTPPTINELLDKASQIAASIAAWEKDPFNPHAVARTRTGAYQKSVVMKYVDALIGWGDQLFRRDTLETLNEATLLYVLAAEILGPRPRTIPPPVTTTEHVTYAELSATDAFGDADLAKLEDYIGAPKGAGIADGGWRVVASTAATAKLFCIPGNDVLLGYWDTVADRLFKLRNCLDIEGVAQKLPLFEPPINPALLVRAAAAGLDLDSVLDDLNAPLPPYRFSPMLQKAVELANEVRGFGALLLSALEKRDAEALALLRAGNERDLLKLVRDVKSKQVDEAAANLEALKNYQILVQAKQKYYSTRPFMNSSESNYIEMAQDAELCMLEQIEFETIAGVLHLIPEETIGLAPGATYGGQNIAGGIQALGSALGVGGSYAASRGGRASAVGSYARRQDDWDNLADLATKELEQIKQQIAAADVRHAIAQTELDNHDAQTDQSETVFETLRDQFTNVDLHQWMIGEVAKTHFQAYQLAYDIARRAERTFQHELGDYDASFIEFGDWDGLRKGLLAGERLLFQLRRLEAAYLAQNQREYELVRHVSLAEIDPVALLRLKATGQCYVRLTENVFDADYPGHYFRRLKTLSLTIACVTGPYRNVNATVTLLGNSVRTSASAASPYARQEKAGSDKRFRDNVGAVQSIATSNAQNDAGMFELTFRDERFLPFEGAGAISEWRIALDPNFNRFDFDTITDVVMHVRYTAREGGQALHDRAVDAFKGIVTKSATTPLAFLVSARRDIGDEWERFVHPPSPDLQALDLDLDALMPYQPAGAPTKVTAVDVFLASTITDGVKITLEDVSSPTPTTLGSEASLTDTIGSTLRHGAISFTSPVAPKRWRLRVSDGGPLAADALTDMFVVIRYERVLPT